MHSHFLKRFTRQKSSFSLTEVNVGSTVKNAFIVKSSASPLSNCVTYQRRNFITSPYGTKITDISLHGENFLATEDSTANSSAIVSSPSEIFIRGRLVRSRIKGNKLGFLVIRQGPSDTIQVVITNSNKKNLEEGLVNNKNQSPTTLSPLEIAKTITPESVVDIVGTVVKSHTPITSTSCPNFELVATKISVVTMAESPLPFTLTDTNTKLDTRLDHRVMDMRTPTTNAVLRLTSKVCQYFRDFLLHPSQDFIEIHSPKMIASPSEGGAAIFQLEYFGKPAFLAQSPQLYKQMALMGDCERVFEIGPVFRAEKSLTHRHLTEFTGLDVEMIIKDSHTEVLNVLEGTLHSIIHRLQTECSHLIAAVGGKKEDEVVILLSNETIEKYGIGSDDKKIIEESIPDNYHGSNGEKGGEVSRDIYGARVGSTNSAVPILRLPFDGAVQMLIDAKIIDVFVDDFNLQQEKQLGELIKLRYGVDVYVIDMFPTSARPFYTMPSSTTGGGEGRTYSYDMYLRGEEICSGAQRIHDPVLLTARAKECGVSTELIKDYIDAFRYGAYPHGGFGLGMERIVLFFLGLSDVRQVSMFPRDPRRITP